MPSIPFVGVARAMFEGVNRDDATFGSPLFTNVGGAIAPLPPGTRMSASGLAHVTRLMASWAWNGLGHPTPLFDRDNRPTVAPRVLSTDERQKLREHPRA